ncbi:MAG: hypothetical protein U1A07_18695, partial [Phenylobacterium sp.]|nr:hypothetical protein [Phenylobacterium sp.]
MTNSMRAPRSAWFMGAALAALAAAPSATAQGVDPLQLAATTVSQLTVTATRQARPAIGLRPPSAPRPMCAAT